MVIAANHLSGKEKQNKVLDELTTNSQEMGMYNEQPEEMTQEVVEPEKKEKTSFFQESVLEDLNKESIVEDEHIDVIKVKPKIKKKRLNKNKKITILNNDEEQRNFYDEPSQVPNKEIEQKVIEEVTKTDFENPWKPKKSFKR